MSQQSSPSGSPAAEPRYTNENPAPGVANRRIPGTIRKNDKMLFPDNLDMFPDNEYTREHGIKRNDQMLFPDNLDIFDYNQPGQGQGMQRRAGGAGEVDQPKKDTLRLRLDLNLDVDVQIRARVHGDVTLSLL
jgi:hypothetical protein